jgi:ATP synthase protein I
MSNQKLALAASVSTNLAAPIIGGILLGYWLDRWLGTNPWMFLVFTILGTVGGFIALIRTVNKINQTKDEE